MTARTGLDEIELSVLRAIDDLGGGSRAYVDASDILDALTPLPSADAALGTFLGLARPWITNVPLIETRSHIDDFVEEPYDLDDDVRARLAAAGKVALDAEDGRCAPIPLGLIVGDTYHEGARPPLKPEAVIASLQLLIAHPDTTSDALLARLGGPTFPTRCTVAGNLDDLYAGRPCTVILRARLRRSRRQTPTVWIDRLPPDIRANDIMIALRDRMIARPPTNSRADYSLSDISDMSANGHAKIECTARPDATMDDLVRFIQTIEGIRTTRLLRYPAPLAELLHEWVTAGKREDIQGSLDQLSQAIQA